ncbi:unnamed protein product [Didymodactylos carnosus]|uniref:EF-hand domain-containing protein n=1 Tax=Didymodactylos carnosus TaxID=1234261 RepID=A0A814EXL1_9BILA|nr:unnamed protein product [Didymodactylos carnosus]CAF0975230.1 unnamed protein product [Didymodactylos carnosus]CAF3564015.1 unnamed protein product [Didymodactylos carnosus]CAF3748089.1 unnamed protein product [Didymodactylos carnosus]
MGNKSGKTDLTELTPKQIRMLQANTNFTPEQIKEWHRSFVRDCPSGKLDKKKFIEVYKQFYPQGKADNFCTYAFHTFDQDNNGYVDFNEFLLAIAVISGGSLEQRLQAAFEMYDSDDSNYVDQKELNTMITVMYNIVGQQDREGPYDPNYIAKQIISELDITDDKKLSKEEFIDGKILVSGREKDLNVIFEKKGDLKDRLDLAFSMYDVDSNGFVDKKELTKIISAIYELNGERNQKKDNAPSKVAEIIIKKFDITDDNRLSREEFISGCMNDPELHELLTP